jgi:hypothetical protein
MADVISFALVAEVACSMSSMRIVCMRGIHEWLNDQQVLLNLISEASNSSLLSGSSRSCRTAAVPDGMLRAESHAGLTSVIWRLRQCRVRNGLWHDGQTCMTGSPGASTALRWSASSTGWSVWRCLTYDLVSGTPSRILD